MQQPDQDTSSPVLILDFVSKFLNNVLEKDRNHSYYLKQWDSFRNLLSAVPLDISSIVSYIANLRPSTSQQAKSFRPKPIMVGGENPSRDQSWHLLSDGEINSSFQLADTPTSVDGASPHKRAFSSHSNGYASSPKFPEQEQLRFQTKRPSNFANANPNNNNSSNINDSIDLAVKRAQGIIPYGSILSDLAKDSPSGYKNIGVDSPSFKVLKNEPVPSHSTPVRYTFTFMTEKAKRLKDNIEKHSEEVAKGGKVKIQTNVLLEARSPLRAVKVYEKKVNHTVPTNPTNPVTNAYTSVGSKPVTIPSANLTSDYRRPMKY